MSSYAGSLVSLLIPVIAFFILIISLVAEWIEPARIPRWYYTFMIVSILIPILVAAIFILGVGADFSWIDSF